MSESAFRQKLGAPKRAPSSRSEDPRQKPSAVSTGIDPFDEGLALHMYKESCPRPLGYLDILKTGTIQRIAELLRELLPKQGPIRVGCEKHAQAHGASLTDNEVLRTVRRACSSSSPQTPCQLQPLNCLQSRRHAASSKAVR